MKIIGIALLLLSFSVFSDDIDQYEQLINSAKEYIVIGFKDPYSAKFEGIFISRSANGEPVVCGTVNAKNSYGAYTGRKRFYYTGGDNVIADISTSGGGFSILYNALCKRGS